MNFEELLQEYPIRISFNGKYIEWDKNTEKWLVKRRGEIVRKTKNPDYAIKKLLKVE